MDGDFAVGNDAGCGREKQVCAKAHSSKDGEKWHPALQMWNESAVLVVCTIEKDMRTLKVSLIASAIGTAVGLGPWIFGLGKVM